MIKKTYDGWAQQKGGLHPGCDDFVCDGGNVVVTHGSRAPSLLHVRVRVTVEEIPFPLVEYAAQEIVSLAVSADGAGRIGVLRDGGESVCGLLIRNPREALALWHHYKKVDIMLDSLGNRWVRESET